MAAGIKQLEKVAGMISCYGDSRLSDRLGEWKQHYDNTEKYKRRAAGLAAAQRRG